MFQLLLFSSLVDDDSSDQPYILQPDCPIIASLFSYASSNGSHLSLAHDGDSPVARKKAFDLTVNSLSFLFMSNCRE